MSETLLREAIRDRRVVEFRYHGEHRVVEPYRLGVGAGRLRLVGWQSRKGWRSFHVAEMEELELAERSFSEPREGYSRGDPAMDRILAEI